MTHKKTSKTTTKQSSVKSDVAATTTLEKPASTTKKAPEPSKAATSETVVKSSLPASNIKQHITKIHINYDVGFGNSLSIRGHGAGLNWNKGIPLKNVKSNEWTWETNATCALVEFKILINDKVYESGPNHSIKCGSTIQYSPKF